MTMKNEIFGQRASAAFIRHAKRSEQSFVILHPLTP
jgi:hypothetical protein